jgi:hypothetical protein
MISEQAATRPGRNADQGLLASIRRASFAMCVVLLVQYGLGIGVNLFVNLPRQDHGASTGAAIADAVSNGPVAVAVHATLGLALVVIALAIAVRAAAARRGGLFALGLVGLLTLGSAAFNGARFVSTGQNSASFSMAMAWAVSLLCYLSVLFVSGRDRPAQPQALGTRARGPAMTPTPAVPAALPPGTASTSGPRHSLLHPRRATARRES